MKLCGYIYNQGTYTHQAGTEKSTGVFYRLPVKVRKINSNLSFQGRVRNNFATAVNSYISMVFFIPRG